VNAGHSPSSSEVRLFPGGVLLDLVSFAVLNCRRAKFSTSMLSDMFTTFRIRECGQSTDADDNRKKESTPFCDSGREEWNWEDGYND